MSTDETTTIDSEKEVAAAKASTSQGMTQAQRYEAINKSVANGNLTFSEASKALAIFGLQDGLNLIPAYAIEPEAIKWLWHGYLAAGKLHILAGAPGTGKTTIALDFASTISLGKTWPDNSKSNVGNILIWSGEDDPKDTLVPRLIAAGADLKNIHFVGEIKEPGNEPRAFNPATDVPELLKRAKDIGNVQLIIIDPIIHAVTGDSHKNGDVRNSLKPVVELATQLNAAVIGITHFTKGTQGKEPLDRVTGSLAFGAVARVVLVTAKESTTNPNPRSLLARAKSNIGLFGGGYYYKIVETTLSKFPGINTSKIVWLEQAEGTVQELLCQSDDNVEQLGVLQEAKEYLVSILEDGAMNANDIYNCCNKAGFAKITIDRAKKSLGLKPYKVGFGKNSVWMWSLQSKIISMPEDSHTKEVSIFGKHDDLKEQLIKNHPAFIDGYSLEDILSHADPQDFEDLLDIAVLKCFTHDLINSGKLCNK